MTAETTGASPHASAAERGRVTVREAVFDFLRRQRMTTIFGNPGSTELPMFREFPADFRYILGLQEAVVIGMADGYAQASRNASLVNLHSAAGVGNAMGNIFTAHKNHTPMVITAGQQARSILPFEPFLASSQATELPKPHVKWSIEPARAADVPHAIARAYYLAMMPPRGPVLVSVPVDDWDQPAELLAHRSVSVEIRPDPVVMERIGAALDASLRPAFVVGGAMDRDGAWNEIISLAERHNARVFTAPMSGRCAFPEDHELFAGFLPAAREPIVRLLEGHDVILTVGAPAFAYHVEGIGPHIPDGATLFQIIDDPATAAWTAVGSAALGSIRLSLLDLLARPASKTRPKPSGRTPAPRVEASDRMSVAYAMQTLNELRRAEDIIVEEAPSSRPVMQAYLPVTRAEGFFTMDSGGLGYGMPAAVGVALAKSGRRVINLMGDGSSMYSIQAIWSAVHLQLPVTFVILRNGAYNALKEFAGVFGFGSQEPVQGTDLPNLDFVLLAKGQGCGGVRARHPGELRDALEAALASPGPFLVEVDVG